MPELASVTEIRFVRGILDSLTEHSHFKELMGRDNVDKLIDAHYILGQLLHHEQLLKPCLLNVNDGDVIEIDKPYGDIKPGVYQVMILPENGDIYVKQVNTKDEWIKATDHMPTMLQVKLIPHKGTSNDI